MNVVEEHKIGGAFNWVRAGHGFVEKGVKIPDLAGFENKYQAISLDRAHPAFTKSTGNYPQRAADRVDEANYPRGHYNMGLVWDHANIVDNSAQLISPLKFLRRMGIGKGTPDQPREITVSVTPRRPRHFVLTDGETLKWSWNEGVLSGVATVAGDTLTIDAIPLVSHDEFRKLRIYR